MSDSKEILETHANRRREFVKSGGKLAVAAPAVAMLLAAGAKPARAQAYGGGGGTLPPTTPRPTFGPE